MLRGGLGVKARAAALARLDPDPTLIRLHHGKDSARVHDHHDVHVPVLAHSLNRRAPGYTSPGLAEPQ